MKNPFNRKAKKIEKLAPLIIELLFPMIENIMKNQALRDRILFLQVASNPKAADILHQLSSEELALFEKLGNPSQSNFSMEQAGKGLIEILRQHSK